MVMVTACLVNIPEGCLSETEIREAIDVKGGLLHIVYARIPDSPFSASNLAALAIVRWMRSNDVFVTFLGEITPQNITFYGALEKVPGLVVLPRTVTGTPTPPQITVIATDTPIDVLPIPPSVRSEWFRFSRLNTEWPLT